MQKTALFLSGLFILSLQACRPSPRQVETAFYHWQTALDLTQTERVFLDSLQVRRLYVKFFDVDWEEATGQAVPLASVQISPASIPNLEIVPTIFITNRTFQNLDETGVDSLAARVVRRIFQLARPLDISRIPQIQIDCDWTASTRQSYFRFLEQVKLSLPKPEILLSTTIRLHQVRYPQRTGVPPVGRGMLMCYNVGELETWQEENSILRTVTAEPYLATLQDYPLPLDLALPIFSWGVLFRGGRMIRLINGLQAEALQDSSRFRQLADNRYQIIKSTYLGGYYLYQDDLLRLESVPVAELTATARLLSASWPGSSLQLSFYHLDTATIKHYSYEQLETIRREMVEP